MVYVVCLLGLFKGDSHIFVFLLHLCPIIYSCTFQVGEAYYDTGEPSICPTHKLCPVTSHAVHIVV